MGRSDGGKYFVLAFLWGLGSSLYLRTPFGFVAMLDLVSFALAVPIFLQSYVRYSKHFKRLLVLCLLWLANGMLSDIWRDGFSFTYFKIYMIIFNSFTLLIVGEWFVRKSYICIPIFLAGASISSVISLYYFQNGALYAFALKAGFEGGTDMSSFLMEKQTYPLWMNMFLMAGVMFARIAIKLPWFVCASVFLASSFLVLKNGGSRSTFLIMASAGFLILMFAYCAKWYSFFFKRKIVTLICLAVAAVAFRTSYYLMAKHGFLGEEGRIKYEEKQAGNTTFLDDRSDIIINWPFLWRSPIIGAGSSLRDRWGYLNRSEYLPHIHPVSGAPINYKTLLGHSALVYSWTAHGVFGLVFWLYILWLLFDFLGERINVFGDYAPFIVYAIISLVWDILFSPYGGFRGKAMFVAAFVAMCQNPIFLQWADANRRGLTGAFRGR